MFSARSSCLVFPLLEQPRVARRAASIHAAREAWIRAQALASVEPQACFHGAEQLASIRASLRA